MSVLDLADAKRHLNFDKAINDGELQSVIDAAEAAIAKRIGPLEPTAKTYRLEGGCHALVLPTLPVISLTSVTPINGAPLTLGDLYLNPDAGIVTYVYGGIFTAFAYDVVYQAGRVDVPDDLLMAIRELMRHLWTPQRGGAQRPGSAPSDALSNTLPGSAFAFPFRVEQLIAPYETSGFA